MTQLIVITGCSGAGKSTLLHCLRARGETVVEEPGRRIVAEELSGDGAALPWTDGVAFARRAVEMSLADLAPISADAGRVFFDRGLIDAAAALEHLTGEPVLARLGTRHRLHPQVFMAPPWPEIYVQDEERQHGFETAVSEYHRLLIAYRQLGYQLITLPKTDVSGRADFMLSTLRTDPGP